ncbi:hypothetical protein [Neorickettsia findlayensis]|uniref:Uncharacterized protein n=1 Tax=Neorickettsia findlayensis TaxID=2686014 RepID=A0A6P1G8X5_9RICK|nr:hypothetical protein [Neorickettsia findlayensis]QHD64926.1 hypothetical protein GP480_00340 [Neorickettsia findlayensis]
MSLISTSLHKGNVNINNTDINERPLFILSLNSIFVISIILQYAIQQNYLLSMFLKEGAVGKIQWKNKTHTIGERTLAENLAQPSADGMSWDYIETYPGTKVSWGTFIEEDSLPNTRRSDLLTLNRTANSTDDFCQMEHFFDDLDKRLLSRRYSLLSDTPDERYSGIESGSQNVETYKPPACDEPDQRRRSSPMVSHLSEKKCNYLTYGYSLRDGVTVEQCEQTGRSAFLTDIKGGRSL